MCVCTRLSIFTPRPNHYELFLAKANPLKMEKFCKALEIKKIKEKSRNILCQSELMKSQIPLEQEIDQLLAEGSETITL